MTHNTSHPEGVLTAITQTLPTRVTPLCRHFGTCGGCQLQDLDYTAQLAAKRTMLHEVLQRAGIAAVPAIEVHAAEPWQYRNRVRLRVEGGSIGYSRRFSNDFLAITECPILSPLLCRAAELLLEIIATGEAAWPPGTGAVELFASGDDSALQLSLQVDALLGTVDRDAPRVFRVLCEKLCCKLPQLAGAGLSVGADQNGPSRKRSQENQRIEIARWGESALTYAVGNRNYRVSRNAFFQVNRFLTAALVSHIIAGHGGSLAFDLFAGAGLFSIPLAERFTQVIAVEIAEPAASDLADQLKIRRSQHLAVHSTVENFLTSHPLARSNVPDLIVLDPPRAGINIATTKALIRTRATNIVYVSCSAATFARDAGSLVQSGYILESLQLFDLFPQTFHTETVAVFRR